MTPRGSAAITTSLERHEPRARDEARRDEARRGEAGRAKEEKRRNRTTWADGENEMGGFPCRASSEVHH